jgi:hypothetical protein
MFANAHFERLRQMFADQFEPDGSNFLYRKSMMGAPIRVNQTERDGFVSTFNRRLRYATWSLVPATLLLIGLLVVLFPHVDNSSAQIAIYTGIGFVLLPFMAGHYWAWNGPARELEHRPTIGEARSREQVRRLIFARITYGQLAFAILGTIALVWKISAKNDVFHGWGVLWLIFAAALIGGTGVQAFRKWRFERY